VKVYKDMHTHCVDFSSELFPSTASLASAIFHFSDSVEVRTVHAPS